MSTPNFHHMKDFPLYVTDCLEETKRCPECGLYQAPDNDECEICGADLSEVETTWEDFDSDYLWDCVQSDMDDINRDLMFHKLELKSGHYSGIQFYVETVHDLEADAEYYDNDECRYQFDLCRSVARRKFGIEQRKICRILEKLAKEYGFEQIVCVGIFSNGEAVYERAGTIRAAACAI